LVGVRPSQMGDCSIRSIKAMILYPAQPKS